MECVFATIPVECISSRVSFPLRCQCAQCDFHERLDPYLVRIEALIHLVSVLYQAPPKLSVTCWLILVQVAVAVFKLLAIGL